MTNLKNKVNRLDWNVPIVTPNGSPTDEFQRKWLQQASTNASIPDLTTAAAVSAVIDLLSSVVGSMLVRGATQWQGLSPSANGKVLRDRGAGNTPQWDTLSTIIDLISNTQGAVLYRDAAAWLALPPGTNGQVLTTQGAAANPLWASSASGGGAASIQDDGSSVYIALSDGDGQLVLDGSGDPIFSVEVFPTAAIPALPYSPSALSSAHIFVGSAGNIATDVAVTGDVTITNAGVTAIKNSVGLAGSPTTTTQSQNDNSTKIATTAYTDLAVANGIAGVNPAVAVDAATTAAGDTSAYVYNNGVGGIGATLTGPTNNVAVTIDGFTFTALGQRLLVKNDTQSPSGAFNGVYYVTQLQGVALKPILTRALDYDMPSDMNETGAIPVINGTVNALTSWLLTSKVVTVGTTPLTYVLFSYAPTFANPTATGSDAAVNGSATTFMRSDAAPAIQKCSNTVFGLTKVDNVTLQAVVGLIGTKFSGLYTVRTTDQSVSNAAYSTILFNSVISDTQSAYVPGTGIFTPTKAGSYFVFSVVVGQVLTTETQTNNAITKNGVPGVGSIVAVSSGNALTVAVSQSTSVLAMGIAVMNGTTDNLQCSIFSNGTGGSNVALGNNCFFGAIYLGP